MFDGRFRAPIERAVKPVGDTLRRTRLTPDQLPEFFPDLTDREREILDKLAAGLTNVEIGRELFLSPKTVANNVSLILSKLHLSERGQAIVLARDAGLGRPG